MVWGLQHVQIQKQNIVCQFLHDRHMLHKVKASDNAIQLL